MRFRKIFKSFLLIMAMMLAFTGCSGKSTAGQSSTSTQTSIATQSSAKVQPSSTAVADSESQLKHYTMADIKKLKNTENFAKSTLEHIFNGTINSKGNATGYHYDMVDDSDGRIVGKKGKADKNGIYTARVEVKGITKSANNSQSTFYPDSMSPQEVIDLINEAYKNRKKVSDDLYSGTAKGIVINMYLNDKNKITTAYPVMK